MFKKIIFVCSIACASLLLSGYTQPGWKAPRGAPRGVSTESEVYKNWCAKQAAVCERTKNKKKHDRCIKQYIKHGCV